MSDYVGPEYATLSDTCERFGAKPSKLYEVLGEGLIAAKKFGKRILIDQRSAKQYFDSLPSAEIKPSPRVRARDWQTRLLAELAAAPTRQQAQLVLSEPTYQQLIRALPLRTREKLKATAQDTISEKSDE